MAGNKRSRTQQTRIAFTPLPSSSPAAKDYHQQIQDRAAAVRYESTIASPSRQRQQPQMSTFLPTPSTPGGAEASSSQAKQPSRRHRSRQQRLDLSTFGTQQVLDADDGISNHEPRVAPADLGFMKHSDSSDSDDFPVRSAKKRRVGARGFMSTANSTRDLSQRRLKLRSDDRADLGVVAPVSSVLPVHAASDDDAASDNEDEDDDEDDMPTTVGMRRKSTQQRHSSPPGSPGAVSDLSSDDEVTIVHTQSTRRNEQQSTNDDDEVDEDDDDDEPLLATPQRRKLKRSKGLTQQERDELDDDLQFLEPSSDSETPRQARDTQSVRKTARMNALEALKRKRAGQSEARTSSPVGAVDVEYGPQELDEPYVIEDDEEEEEDLPPTSSRSIFQADDEDEQFLDDNDEGDDALGVPADIPLEFTSYASAKPKELFKFAVEWMVQKKINPAFNMTDDLYDLTFKKLNDEVLGLARSKFSSSVWTADFSMSLNTRPTIAVEELIRVNSADFLNDHCDACNRSGHPATFQIQFQGKPYHPETLDDVEAKSDDDDDDSSSERDNDSTDKSEYDAKGRKVPPASRIYQVGRFCAANAETVHELQHWKLNLYDWVVRWIEDAGYTTADKLIQRDRWSTKKRRKFANKISDEMTETGVTKKLWKEFRDSIIRAQNSKQGRYA